MGGPPAGRTPAHLSPPTFTTTYPSTLKRAQVSSSASFEFEGQCLACGKYSSHTNVHNQCRECAKEKELTWPPVVPELVQAWPVPLRTKMNAARWYGTEAEYRAFFEHIIEIAGEDALALVYNDSPRTPTSHPTRWFAPGLPMHYTGEQISRNGKVMYLYLLPAQAALMALDGGFVQCQKSRRAG